MEFYFPLYQKPYFLLGEPNTSLPAFFSQTRVLETSGINPPSSGHWFQWESAQISALLWSHHMVWGRHFGCYVLVVIHRKVAHQVFPGAPIETGSDCPKISKRPVVGWRWQGGAAGELWSPPAPENGKGQSWFVSGRDSPARMCLVQKMTEVSSLCLQDLVLSRLEKKSIKEQSISI